jgi:hypothetical protein
VTSLLLELARPSRAARLVGVNSTTIIGPIMPSDGNVNTSSNVFSVHGLPIWDPLRSTPHAGSEPAISLISTMRVLEYACANAEDIDTFDTETLGNAYDLSAILKSDQRPHDE